MKEQIWMFIAISLFLRCENAHARKGETLATDEDRAYCRGVMYSQRTAKGRGAPNWNLYDYCIREQIRKHEKEKGQGKAP